jgi:hypothetical protein
MVLQTVRSSKKSLTADEVAKLLKAVRPHVAPYLRSLASSGQIVEVEGSPVRFAAGQGTSAPAPASGNVVQLVPNTKKAAAKKAPAEPKPETLPEVAATPAKRGVGRPRKSDANKSSEKPAVKKSQVPPKAAAAVTAKPAQTTDVKPAAKEMPSVASANVDPDLPSAAILAIAASSESPRNKVLRMLAIEPISRDKFLAILGEEVAPVIEEMKTSNELSYDFIFDRNVYDLTSAGTDSYRALPPLEALVEAPVAPVEAPAQPAKGQKAKAPARQVQGSLLPDDAKASVEKAEKPAPTAKSQTEEAPAPAAQQSPENPIMAEMAKLMEKLVGERIGELAQQVEQGQRDRETLIKVGSSIQKATAALQIALDALNEIGDSISE